VRIRARHAPMRKRQDPLARRVTALRAVGEHIVVESEARCFGGRAAAERGARSLFFLQDWLSAPSQPSDSASAGE
jgi:hypothetical protein